MLLANAKHAIRSTAHLIMLSQHHARPADVIKARSLNLFFVTRHVSGVNVDMIPHFPDVGVMQMLEPFASKTHRTLP